MSRQKLSRREMLERSMFASAAAVAAQHVNVPVLFSQESDSPNNTIRVAITGVNGRGGSHISELKKRKGAEIAAIIDVDEAVGQRNCDALEKELGKRPTFYTDIRKCLEDKSIDAVSIATPNH